MRTKTIAFDFDMTLAMYDPKYWATKYVVKVPVRAKPNLKLRKLMDDLWHGGHRVIIYTSRWWGDFCTIKNWLDKHEFLYHDIICGRFVADCYICDKSINAWYPDVANRCYDMIRRKK